ncbi:helix-turn-helix domain-containing protein [Loigolactobacillus zhaoyuanensis]|uniref:helix-turn-helix domain-containing protein n=1 Tax=Loigolactobacillus zhaoyuanensis TaxID=2486017 RepID=UPI000F741560|nr:helix-turn-helix domain-containing protein [Loigolactobacillus zhaoyuanensis]
MFKEDLLDKQDRIMVSLLEQLYLADGAVSKQALSQQLSISVSSLNRYVNQLVLELQASITAGLVKLELTPNQLQLSLDGQVTLNKLYLDDVFHNSIDCQILLLMYRKGKINLHELILKLAISEASLYRHIQHINRVLREFKITIRHGQLVGPELQIRYFYYQLFTKVLPLEIQPNILHNQYIEHLESYFAYQFNTVANQRIKLWITISQQRQLTINQFDQQLPSAINELSRDNILFERINDYYLQLFARTPNASVDFETKALFAMLLSTSVFNSYATVVQKFADIYQHNQTELSQLLAAFNQVIRRELLLQPEQWPFNFSKLLFDALVKPYLFNGELTTFNPPAAAYYRQFYFTTELQTLVAKVLAKLKQSACPQLRLLVATNSAYFQHCLLLILNEFQGQQQREITIGLATDFTDIFERLLISKLQRQLHDQWLINITMYQPGHDYDLVITNQTLPIIAAGQQVYQLTQLGTKRDIHNIEEIINYIGYK